MTRRTRAAPAAALPIVTFGDGVTLHWNGETIRVQHVAPAHTDGDSHIWFENANAVHMGDTFVNGFYPFIDIESGGTVARWAASSTPRIACWRAPTRRRRSSRAMARSRRPATSRTSATWSWT